MSFTSVSYSTLNRIPQPSAAELESLKVQKGCYTQVYHNQNPFVLIKLEDFHAEKVVGSNTQRWKTNKCKHCSIEFSPLGIPPEDVAFVHWERFEFFLLMENARLQVQ